FWQDQHRHDAPLHPTHKNVDNQICNDVLRGARRQKHNHRAAEEVDQNAEEKPEQEPDRSKNNSAAELVYAFLTEQAHAHIAPRAVRDEFASKIEKGVHVQRLRERMMLLTVPVDPVVLRRKYTRKRLAGVGFFRARDDLEWALHDDATAAFS